MATTVFLGDGIINCDGCRNERDVIKRVFEFLEDYEDSDCYKFCILPTTTLEDGLPLEGELEFAIYGKTEDEYEED